MPIVQLSDEDRHACEIAFKRIDQNGDGVLDKDEVKHCLAHLSHGAEPSDEEVSQMCKDAGHDMVQGIDMKDFVDLVASAAAAAKSGDQGAASKLASMLHTNLDKVQSLEFVNAAARELWERNHLHHKKADMDYASLSKFTADDEVHCARCHKRYHPKDNADTSCTFHPGKRIQEDSHTMNADTIRFTCCKGVEVGMQHTVAESGGCQKGKHLNNDEFHVWLKENGHR
mmetsp:Transcript_17302/g.39927  ORF Transcript_17302/g.39927 Transcript_17302/m.39927 type:complete len:228 (+) Transcript_17302:178-861(+)|eukprot:CAMPEP_0114142262 /NCGR_PEP_ID=MMETSP0043_2-20121206/18355_1 /TAXON_ID=464988 /ORGANISM="Hemiselmis andersenii, Strain CCMP644" /LENGTH=227 /DNA_ID=CAMNT_0001236473 /DNA_START=174 /DNA_END=857 /DNA_ORIENTATION=+